MSLRTLIPDAILLFAIPIVQKLHTIRMCD